MLSSIIRIKMQLFSSKVCCTNYMFTEEHYKLYNSKMYEFKKETDVDTDED